MTANYRAVLEELATKADAVMVHRYQMGAPTLAVHNDLQIAITAARAILAEPEPQPVSVHLAAPLQPMLRVHRDEAAPGFVTVPREPTPEMILSGYRRGPDGSSWLQYPAECYRAMIAAAPSQPNGEIAAQAAPVEAQPVAWRYRTNGVHWHIDLCEPPDDAYDEGTLTPLYIHPAAPSAPQARMLTEAEIDEVLTNFWGNKHATSIMREVYREFARTVESAVNGIALAPVAKGEM